jgi:hypothetical protein
MGKFKKISLFIFLIGLIVICCNLIEVRGTTLNNDPMLKDIKINGESINFDMFTTEYVITYSVDVNSIDIDAIPDDTNATVEIIGDLKLSNKKTEIEIKVTAENKQDTQSYFLYITKGNEDETNAYLKNIEIDGCELTPEFNKDIINYSFEYASNLENVNINAIPEDENAKVEIIGNNNLTEVSQTIEIKVIAKDEITEKTYYLIAKKQDMDVESPEGNEPTKIDDEDDTEINSEENTEIDATINTYVTSSNLKLKLIIFIILFIGVLISIFILIKNKRKKKKE